MLFDLPDDLILELFRFANDNANFILFLKKCDFHIKDEYIGWNDIHFGIVTLQRQYDPELYHWKFFVEFYQQLHEHKQYIANLPINFFKTMPPLLLDWNTISEYRRVNQPWSKEDDLFVNLFRDYIEWHLLTKVRMQHFSLSFLRENRHYIDWIWISSINDLSASFVTEFMQYLNLFVVLQHSNLGTKYVQLHCNQFKADEEKCKTFV